MLQKLIKTIPEDLWGETGSVFYSGSEAFSGKRDVFLLGLNPGGPGDDDSYPTIGDQLKRISNKSFRRWSVYQDEKWKDKEPGTHVMQPRVLYLLRKLNLDPQLVPASNTIFERSRQEKDITGSTWKLQEQCWNFHQSVIDSLGVRLVICFGQSAGNFVRYQLKANKTVDEFEEKNDRKWKTRIYEKDSGIRIVVATHPSRADWTNP